MRSTLLFFNLSTDQYDGRTSGEQYDDGTSSGRSNSRIDEDLYSETTDDRIIHQVAHEGKENCNFFK